MTSLLLTQHLLTDNILEPFIRLWRGEGDMKENLQDISPILEETGRIIYQNSNITVNTLPAILAALLLGACKY